MNKTSSLLLFVLTILVTPAMANSGCPDGYWKVDGTDAIYLAGRSDITVPPKEDTWNFLLRHAYSFTDEVQETHPVSMQVTEGIAVRALVPADGGVDYFNYPSDNFFPPDGNSPLYVSTLDAIDGISGYKGPEGALAGVFLNDNVPDTGPAPATLDFSSSGLGTDFTGLSPDLGQVFFIGDGFTSSAVVQTFIAPTGATRLFLGIPDGFGFDGHPGAYDDNDGYFCIDLNDQIYVNIDIKPGSFPNSINLCSNGVVPVAIFSSSDFDVTIVDTDTLRLADVDVKMVGKSGRQLCSYEDANLDGLTDLVCHFDTVGLSLAGGDTSAKIIGETIDGIPIEGEDSVNIVKDGCP